jgi:hypothetical protein
MYKKTWRLCLPVMVGIVTVGCGAIPDVVVDAAKQSAKAEIEEKIDELLAELGDQLDLSMFLPTVPALDSEEEDEPGRDPQR